MNIQRLHAWNVTPAEAIAIQKELAARLIDDTPIDLSTVRYIAGVDVSVKNNISQAAVVVQTYPELELVETIRTQQPTAFPYIPGLLTFREGSVLVEAFEKLVIEPDIFIFDGMGQIHPRRTGIAAHLGLWLDKPTIGCGKTHFIGDYAEPGRNRGDYSILTYKGDALGVVLRTRANVKPVFVSVGHRADINSAIQLIMSITPKYRLPQPIRLAHNMAGNYDEL